MCIHTPRKTECTGSVLITRWIEFVQTLHWSEPVTRDDERNDVRLKGHRALEVELRKGTWRQTANSGMASHAKKADWSQQMRRPLPRAGRVAPVQQTLEKRSLRQIADRNIQVQTINTTLAYMLGLTHAART